MVIKDRRTLAFLTAISTLLWHSAASATSCTTGGVSYFGTEYYASSLTASGGTYKVANLQCSGGQVIAWMTTSYYSTPEQIFATVMSTGSNPNMRRIFKNSCGSHFVVYHNNFYGSAGGVAADNYALNNVYTDVFSAPLYYSAPSGLMCQATPGIGDPDMPGVCPVASDSPLPPTGGAPSARQGNPIDVAYGNKFQVEMDYSGKPGSGLHFVRFYNSKTGNWSHTYGARLVLKPTQALLVFADGRQSFFTLSGTTATGSAKELGKLESVTGGWRYSSPQNEQFTFNTQGVLTQITRANASTETLTYGTNQITVTDTLGNTLTMALGTLGRLTSMTVGSLQVAYTYNANGRLTKATYTRSAQSWSKTYHYEDTRDYGRLTGITDERGVRYATWAYDSAGRAIKSEHSNAADQTLLTYNSNGSTLVTNALGKQATYNFQTLDGVKRISSIQGLVSANCPASNASFTYNPQGLIATRTDNKGNLTTYQYNSRGLEVSRTEASGTAQARTITTDWHPTLFLPTTVTEPGRVIQYQYDAQGNLLSETISAP